MRFKVPESKWDALIWKNGTLFSNTELNNKFPKKTVLFVKKKSIPLILPIDLNILFLKNEGIRYFKTSKKEFNKLNSFKGIFNFYHYVLSA